MSCAAESSTGDGAVQARSTSLLGMACPRGMWIKADPRAILSKLRTWASRVEKTHKPGGFGTVESVHRGMKSLSLTQGRIVLDRDSFRVSEHAIHLFRGSSLDTLSEVAN